MAAARAATGCPFSPSHRRPENLADAGGEHHGERAQNATRAVARSTFASPVSARRVHVAATLPPRYQEDSGVQNPQKCSRTKLINRLRFS